MSEREYDRESRGYLDRFLGPRGGGIMVGFYGFFILLWVVLGLAAFVMSVLCFGYTGSTAQHVAGVLFALMFGPFYWIYYAVSNDYCGKTPTSILAFGGRK